MRNIFESKSEARGATPETKARLLLRKMAYIHIKQFIGQDHFGLDQMRLLLGKFRVPGVEQLRISDLFYEAVDDLKGSDNVVETFARLGIKEIEKYSDADHDTAAVMEIEKVIFSEYLQIAAENREKHQ